MKISNFVRSAGTLTLINFAKKHNEKLTNSDIEAILELAPRVTDTIAALETEFGIRRPLTSEWKTATSTKNDADNDLDNEIADMSYELLGPKLLAKDRNHPDYRALFPEGNITFIYGPEREEATQVAAIISYLENHPDHPMADRAEVLTPLLDAFNASLKPMAAAESKLRAAQAKEGTARAALAKVLRKNTAILRAEMMDEKKVEAYFPPIPSNPNNDDPPDDTSI